jgi:threonine/homoserine/homoserine lactone efflux protein
MSPDLLAPLIVLAFASAWTPGPNNAMLASSGATFGLRPTVPHALGVALGFPVMTFLVMLALGELYRSSGAFREGVRWGGVALLLWVAFKIATAGGLGEAKSPRPMRFHEAAAFQWINPKAWVMALGIGAQFVDPARPVPAALAVSGVFVAAGLSSAFGWAGAGHAMRRFLADPLRLRAFNLAMAALIAASVVPLATG